MTETRLAFAYSSLLGRRVRVWLRDGTEVSGQVRAVQRPTKEGWGLQLVHVVVRRLGTGGGGLEDGGALRIQGSDVLRVHASGIPVGDGVGRSVGVRTGVSESTDALIGAKTATQGLHGRELQRASAWVSSEVSGDLDAPVGRENWDQFEANKRLFGVNAEFEEDKYTTRVAKGLTLEQKARAAQTAAEIERSSRRPRRGKGGGVEQDDAALFSDVVRKPGAYVPPHDRTGETGEVAKPPTTEEPPKREEKEEKRRSVPELPNLGDQSPEERRNDKRRLRAEIVNASSGRASRFPQKHRRAGSHAVGARVAAHLGTLEKKASTEEGRRAVTEDMRSFAQGYKKPTTSASASSSPSVPPSAAPAPPPPLPTGTDAPVKKKVVLKASAAEFVPTFGSSSAPPPETAVPPPVSAPQSYHPPPHYAGYPPPQYGYYYPPQQYGPPQAYPQQHYIPPQFYHPPPQQQIPPQRPPAPDAPPPVLVPPAARPPPRQ